MQGLDRIMSIIKVLVSNNNKWFTKKDISERTELPISTIHRLLDAMEQHNMVSYDPDHKVYQIGHIWLKYGLEVYDSIHYISSIRPELEELMTKIQASVYLLKPLKTESIIIERIDCTNQAIATHDKLGTTVPLYKGAANLGILAYINSEIIKNCVMDKLNEVEQEEVEKHINFIKENKYAILDDEENNQITNIASPILNSSGNILGAINVKFEKQQLHHHTSQQEIINTILFTTNKISWKLKNSKHII